MDPTFNPPDPASLGASPSPHDTAPGDTALGSTAPFGADRSTTRAEIRDRRPQASGLLPRRAQTWIMLGLALLIVSVILITGSTTPAPFVPSATAVVPADTIQPARVRSYQDRLAEQEARLRQELANTTNNPANSRTPLIPEAQAPAPPPPVDPLVEERRRRDEQSLFADNVAFSRRSDARVAPPAAPSAPVAPTSSLVAALASPLIAGMQPPTALASQVAATAPAPSAALATPLTVMPSPASTVTSPITTSPPLPIAALPSSPPTTAAASPSATSQTVEALTSAAAPKPGPSSPPPVPAPVSLSAVSQSLFTVLEGTFLETVLINRLDGTFQGPVQCLVTTPLYSHDRQFVLVPAGARVLGSAAPVQNWGDRRLAVRFHRLVMPDGRNVPLDTFTGLNQVGETGLTDEVNRHYWQVFGASLAVGAISGLAQAGTRTTFDTSFEDTARSGAGSSFATTAARILDRYLNVLPTITIREGHRIKVVFTTDLTLPAYAPLGGSR